MSAREGGNTRPRLTEAQRTWLRLAAETTDPRGIWITQPQGSHLATHGLVTCVERRGNNRRRYQITPAGRAEVEGK